MASDQATNRGKWARKLDFMLSSVGFAVGLGNVWRFPYLCYRHGGATFLIPYLIMLLLVGLPLFFLEQALGQFASEGAITVWKMSPAFAGIGVAMVTVSTVVCIYYNVVIMWAIYYMLVSFVNLDDEVPWRTCGNSWNSYNCRTEPFPNLDVLNETSKLTEIYKSLYNKTCVGGLVANISAAYNTTLRDVEDVNSSMIFSQVNDGCKLLYTIPSEDYWENVVLRLDGSTGFDDLGGFSLKLVVCLFLAWILIFFCLIKGVKSSGKVVYFTATFPYVILVALLIRGVTLPGHLEGIKFYMIPNLSRLADGKVWGDAASQIFFSLGPGFGGLLTISSYNRFHNNCLRDAVIVALINCGTSIFAGFAIFSLLGFMATITNRDIASVVKQGPGLVFIAFPEGIARLPISPLWAFLFFFMLVTMGLDSEVCGDIFVIAKELKNRINLWKAILVVVLYYSDSYRDIVSSRFVTVESVISGLTDLSPNFLRKYKMWFTLACCLLGFILGLPQVTKGGVYWFTLTDWYSGSFNIILTGLAEIICVMYVYGMRNFLQDIEMMIGYKPNIYWKATWAVIAPITIMFILIMSAISWTPASYGDYVFPSNMQGLGWFMSFGSFSWIIIIMIVQMIRYGPKRAFQSSPEWGPADPEDRKGRYASTDRSFSKTSPDIHAVGSDNVGKYILTDDVENTGF